MTRICKLAAAILAGFLYFTSANLASAETLRVETVTVVTGKGRFEFRTEFADTPGSRRQGLMFRKSMPADHAMLFDWGGPINGSMWMRNTYISLDMLFIAGDGTIRHVAENTKPLSLDVISAGVPVAAVLEVIAGTAKRIGLRPGDRVVHPMFKAP